MLPPWGIPGLLSAHRRFFTLIGSTDNPGYHRNAVCVSGSKIHRVAGNAPINPGFFAMRASCHIGGWPGADVHSDMRVNGFLYAQSVVMWIQHQNRRVAWLGAGDSHPFGSRTKCSCPAEARSASKCENMLWNRGFMYKWRGRLLLLL